MKHLGRVQGRTATLGASVARRRAALLSSLVAFTLACGDDSTQGGFSATETSQSSASGTGPTGGADSATASRGMTASGGTTGGEASGGPSTAADESGESGGGPTLPRAGAPVVLFTDLSYGSNSGWSTQTPDLGAVVTVWGRGFGASRGGSFVTVNGTDLTADTAYVDTWGKTENPVPFLESITFQLDSSVPTGEGEVTVTVDGDTSNEVAFGVGTSSIYFVDVNASPGGSGSLEDPWQDLSEYIDVMAAGDVAYFRAGVYDEIYNGGKSNIWVRDSEPSGTATQPIAFVGYPGEWPMFDSDTNGDTGDFNRSVVIDAAYITVAKIATTAFGAGIEAGAYGRIIGNDTVGCREFVSGTGIIISGGDGARILGNTLHGARSGDRLDHALYLSGCSPVAGSEVAFNFSYDNSFDRGPHMVVNHQESRCSDGEYLKSHSFHHNLIDCTGSPSRAIGIYDQSWDEGEPVEPEPTYVYNNITDGCGVDGFPAMYHNNGHAVFYNNTLLRSVGPGFDISADNVLSTTIVNNIVVQAQDAGEYINGEPSTVDNNLYFGGGPYSGADANALEVDPELEPGAFGLPYGVGAGSPLIDRGTSMVEDTVVNDFNATPRPQGEGYDLGAVEFVPR